MASASGTVQVVIGPVIGSVSDTTCRILFEFEKDVVARLRLTKRDDKTYLEFEQKFVRHIPQVFRCSGLEPDTEYTISVTNATGPTDGIVTTFPSVTEKVRVICAACDKPKKRGAVNMWDKIYREHISVPRDRRLHILVHHGDQVYADNAFKAGMKIMAEEGTESESARQRRMTEEYAKFYRAVWSREDSRRVVGYVSNLCMWDDHEVRNDWGTNPPDYDKSSTEYAVGLAARQAFWWYQRQLWDDLPGSDTNTRRVGGAKAVEAASKEADEPASARAVTLSEVKDPAGGAATGGAKPESVGEVKEELPTESLLDGWRTPEAGINTEFYTYVLPGGRVGLAFVDVRGSRSYYRTKDSYLSEPQWSALERTFDPRTGAFAKVGAVIVVHTSPLLLFGPGCSSTCKCLSADKVGMGLYPEEQHRYLTLLADWKASRLESVSTPSKAPAADRELLVIGGDLHFAIRTQVKRGGKPVFKQMVTSALSNTPPFWFQYYIFRCIMSCCASNGDFEFSHGDHHPDRNVGHVEATWPVGGKSPEIVETIIKGRDVCCDYRGCCYC